MCLTGRAKLLFLCLATTLCVLSPAVARADVQTGSSTGADDPDIPAYADLRKVAVRHDTAGDTTFTATLRAAPPASSEVNIRVLVMARDYTDECVDPALFANGSLVPGTAEIGAVKTDPAGNMEEFTATRSNSGATVTVKFKANLGVQAGCAAVQTVDGQERKLDTLAMAPLTGWARPEPPPPPPPPPKPTPTPPPPPEPEPPMEPEQYTGKVGTFGPSFRLDGRMPKLDKRKRSYIYGICRYSVCRIDPVTRRSTRVLRSAKKDQAYGHPSVSQRGSVLAFDRSLEKGRRVYRAARDGRIQRVWQEGVDSPVVRADGRSVTTENIYSRLSCLPVFDFYGTYMPNCVTQTGPAIDLRSTGEPKAKQIASDLADIAWWRDQILYRHSTEDDRNQDTYICALDPDGNCSRAIAKLDGRALHSPATSPDGRYLAVISEPAPANNELTTKGKGQILLFAPQTGRLIRAVTKGTGDSNPTFSPDGKQIAFNRGGNLLVVPLNGRKPRLIKQQVTINTNSWGLAK